MSVEVVEVLEKYCIVPLGGYDARCEPISTKSPPAVTSRGRTILANVSKRPPS